MNFYKKNRLRTRADFRLLERKSKRFVGKKIVVDACENCQGYLRLGITASKKYGDAHQRNRFKRLVREAFRLSLLEHTLPIDLNVRPRHTAKNATMQQIQEELITLIPLNLFR